jgi:hypothetical protein
MRHPFENIPPGKRGPIFGVLLALTLGVMGVLRVVDGPLKTADAPNGIVSFELAGDVPTAQAILNAWDPLARTHAGFSLGFDFVFLVLYSTTIALACAWLAQALRERWRPLASAGLLLAWAQWLAALLDVVENAALLVVLLEAPRAPWPQIARWCALPKFALVFLGLTYVVLGLLLRLAKSRR